MRAAPRRIIASAAGIGDARRHAVGMRVRARHRHHAAGLEATGHRPRASVLCTPMISVRRPSRSRARMQPQMPRAEADRHVERVERRRAAEQLQRIGSDAAAPVGREGRREVQPLAPPRAAWPPRAPRRNPSPCSTSVAPKARMAAFFSTLLPRGTTMVTGTPARAPAKARLWPWLPRVAETMPRHRRRARAAAGPCRSGRRAP